MRKQGMRVSLPNAQVAITLALGKQTRQPREVMSQSQHNTQAKTQHRGFKLSPSLSVKEAQAPVQTHTPQ
jgi:hypothetical protein